MAHHPQYTGAVLRHLATNPYADLLNNNFSGMAQEVRAAYLQFTEDEIYQKCNALKNMQKYAERIGCCEINQSLFFIKHIYCGNVHNYSHIIQNSLYLLTVREVCISE